MPRNEARRIPKRQVVRQACLPGPDLRAALGHKVDRSYEGYVWIDLDGPPRTLPARWLEIEMSSGRGE